MKAERQLRHDLFHDVARIEHHLFLDNLVILPLGDSGEERFKAPGNPRLIVTIARKGYQFIANVSIAEAHIRRQVPVQGTAAESLGADARSAYQSPAKEAIPKAPSRWRKVAVVGASAAVLPVVVGFVSWRHFAGITPPKVQKIKLAVLPFQNLTGDPLRNFLRTV